MSFIFAFNKQHLRATIGDVTNVAYTKDVRSEMRFGD